jgi:hypothetical protein
VWAALSGGEGYLVVLAGLAAFWLTSNAVNVIAEWLKELKALVIAFLPTNLFTIEPDDADGLCDFKFMAVDQRNRKLTFAKVRADNSLRIQAGIKWHANTVSAQADDLIKVNLSLAGLDWQRSTDKTEVIYRFWRAMSAPNTEFNTQDMSELLAHVTRGFVIATVTGLQGRGLQPAQPLAVSTPVEVSPATMPTLDAAGLRRTEQS